MSMDFSGGQDTTAFDLIPNGTLAWAYILYRGLKASSTGGAYLDIELTIAEGHPFERRKIFEKIGDPYHAANGDTYKQMGATAIKRILEAARNASPQNPQGYTLASYDVLDGLRVPIKVGIEKSKDAAYEDKNRATFLTPNPASESAYKDYQKLMSGHTHTDPSRQAPPPAQTSMFPPQPQPPASTQTPQWEGGQPARGQPGFPPPQGVTNAAPAATHTGAGSSAPAAAPTPATPHPSQTTTSPSEQQPAAAWGGQAPANAANPPAPNWMKQANQGR